MPDKLKRPDGTVKIGWETLLVAGLLVMTFIPFLGENLFSTKGEPREAVIAVSMLKSGNWILPVTFGAEIPYKPPMLAWCVAALGKLNGGVVTEFLSRLPSAIAMIVMCLAGFRLYARRGSVNMAVAMVLITAGSFEVFRNATICRVDMLVTMFIVTALYAFYRQWYRHPGGTWRPSLLAALLMTGGVLTKGPVGMLLPCMVIFVFRLMKGNGFRQTVVSVGLAALLSLLLPAAWYFAAYQQGGDEFLRLAMEENFGRFTGTMSYESHENPAWYNLLTLSYGISPYNLLLLLSLGALPFVKRASASAKAAHTLSGWWRRLRSMEPLQLFSMLAAVLIFVFYCIPKSKRSVYLLPVYPFVAYFIAIYARWLLGAVPRLVKTYCWVIAVIGTAVSGAVLAAMWGWIDPSVAGERQMPVMVLLRSEGTRFIPVAFTILALAGGIWLRRELIFSRARGCFGWTMVYTLVIYWMVSAAVLPAAMNHKSDRLIALYLERTVNPGEPLYSYRPDPMWRYYTVNFYMHDRLRLFDVEQPQQGTLIVGDEDFETLLQTAGDSYTFRELAAITRRSSETGQPVILLRFSRH